MRPRLVSGAAAILCVLAAAPAEARGPTPRPAEASAVDLRALRGALADLRRRGALGDRMLTVTYDTRRPGIRLSPAVRRRYPALITIVLQYQFANLVLSRSGFAVDLWFSGRRERVVVPYAAVVGFENRAVEFDADI